jgi:hypothetical protein
MRFLCACSRAMFLCTSCGPGLSLLSLLPRSDIFSYLTCAARCPYFSTKQLPAATAHWRGGLRGYLARGLRHKIGPVSCHALSRACAFRVTSTTVEPRA